MLSSASSHQSINRNQLNKSSAKHLFSFPKQSRFVCKTQSVTSDVKYSDLPGMAQLIQKRGISFTKSKKSLIFQNERQQKSLPPPNIYNIINNKPKLSGFSIGLKLKNIASRNPENTPGPNVYNSIKTSKSGSRHTTSFSRQVKQLKYPISDRKGKDSPGPYFVETKKLNDLLSKYKKSRDTKIGPISKRTEVQQRNIKKTELQLLQKSKKKSIYDRIQNKHTLAFCSSRKSIVFGRAHKKTMFDIPLKQTRPGPNNYSLFSEFADRNKPKNKSVQLKSLPAFSKAFTKQSTAVNTTKTVQTVDNNKI